MEKQPDKNLNQLPSLSLPASQDQCWNCIPPSSIILFKKSLMLYSCLELLSNANCRLLVCHNVVYIRQS